jgi:hypothetical protein
LNIHRFRNLGIRIISAIIFAWLVFLIWNPNPDESRVIHLTETQIGIQVETIVAEQKISRSENQPITPSHTLTPDNATATRDADLTLTTVKISTETLTPTPTGTPDETLTHTPTPSLTATLTPSLTGTSAPTSSPTTTQIPTNTWTPAPARISGQLLVNGMLVDQDTTLILEDQSFNQIAETITLPVGRYLFDGVPANLDGYNVLFSQERNSSFGEYEVFSNAWIGPIVVSDGASIDLPDFDIGLQGLEYTNPIPDSQIPISTITDDSPLTFRWTGYPYAGSYWVTLLDGDNFAEIWKSGLVSDTNVDFNGTLMDGSRIQPGQHWWGVGVQGTLGEFAITAFGFLDGFLVIP